MTRTAAPALPDHADVVMVGRPFPVRDALAPITHKSVVELLVACRTWWLDAAAAYLALAEAGCDESVYDARDALAKADTYAPATALRTGASSVTTRKSIATLLGEWADRYSHTFHMQTVAGLITYWVGGQRVEREVILHAMDHQEVPLCSVCATSDLTVGHLHRNGRDGMPLALGR